MYYKVGLLLTSMSGPQINVDNAMLTNMTELVVVTRASDTEKDLDSSGMAANSAVLDRKAVKTIQLDTKTTRLLRHNGRLLIGQSGSLDSVIRRDGCTLVSSGTTRVVNTSGTLQKLGVG